MLYDKNPSELQVDDLLWESRAVLRTQKAVHLVDLATKAERVFRQFGVTPAPATTGQGTPLFCMNPDDVEEVLREVEAGLRSVPGTELLVSKISQTRTSLVASKFKMALRPTPH